MDKYYISIDNNMDVNEKEIHSFEEINDSKINGETALHMILASCEPFYFGVSEKDILKNMANIKLSIFALAKAYTERVTKEDIMSDADYITITIDNVYVGDSGILQYDYFEKIVSFSSLVEALSRRGFQLSVNNYDELVSQIDTNEMIKVDIVEKTQKKLAIKPNKR